MGGAKFFQKGNVYVRTGAILVIRDTEFVMARGAALTVHVYFFAEPGAQLIIERSTSVITRAGPRPDLSAS